MARATPQGGESKQGLVVTLVFFILATIGAGVAAYYGFADKDKIKADRKAGDKDAVKADKDKLKADKAKRKADRKAARDAKKAAKQETTTK